MAVKIADSLKATVVLNDGVRMPMFGLGMFKSSGGTGGEAETAVCYALQTCYRLIDTAVFHGTEEDIGRGIKKSGVKREDIFIISKPWIDSHGSEKVKKAFHESLKKLDNKYVDLYMIHSPVGGKNVETYKATQELKKEGLIRSVGVTNFNIHHLEGLEKAELPTPSVNQIELHPWMRRAEAVNYCRKEGITVMGYSPLAKGQNINDPTIASLSKKYNKSVGQIIVRWSVQSGFITIPKTSKPHRIVENSQVFDWSLDEEDMNTMNNFAEESCMTRHGWNPMDSEWTG